MEGTRPDGPVQYLRKHQRDALHDEARRLEHMASRPDTDAGEARKALHRIRHQLATQSPPELSPELRDRFSQREEELRNDLIEGMPSQEEMRKMPPGAVEKHMSWEERVRGRLKVSNKRKLQIWKNLMVALHPDDDSPELANFERYRPRMSSLNMDNAHIPGKQYHFAPPESTLKGLEHRMRHDMTFGDEKTKQEAEEALEMLREYLAKAKPKEDAEELSAKDAFGEEKAPEPDPLLDESSPDEAA